MQPPQHKPKMSVRFGVNVGVAFTLIARIGNPKTLAARFNKNSPVQTIVSGTVLSGVHFLGGLVAPVPVRRHERKELIFGNAVIPVTMFAHFFAKIAEGLSILSSNSSEG